MRTLLISLVLIVAGSCTLQSPQNSPPKAPATQRAWTKLETLCKLDDKSVDESSGIAPSHTQEGIYYTHNDSGDKPRFFAFDRKGHVTATIDVSKANAVDWEDMASAVVDGKPYLFFGDIGDNKEKRDSIVVYRVPEPRPGANSADADAAYTLTYPDGAHNAEALMVHPRTGDLYIVTKTSKGPSLVFKCPNPSGSTGALKLQKIGEIQVGGPIDGTKLVTGGDISPDGKHIVIRGYLGAWEFDAPATFDDWVNSKPRAITTNVEPQGEAICYSPDGKKLLTTSEGAPCQVSEGTLEAIP